MNRAALIKTTWSILSDNNDLYQFVKDVIRLSSSGRKLRKVNSSLVARCHVAINIIFDHAF